MNLVIDTNCYTDFASGEPAVVQIIQTAEKVFIPFIVLAELRAGFLCGTKARENEAILTRILNQPTVTALYPDGETTHHYAAIFSQLRRQATPIPTNDLWIAALAIQHELVLFTRDAHFARVPQVARV